MRNKPSEKFPTLKKVYKWVRWHHFQAEIFYLMMDCGLWAGDRETKVGKKSISLFPIAVVCQVHTLESVINDLIVYVKGCKWQIRSEHETLYAISISDPLLPQLSSILQPLAHSNSCVLRFILFIWYAQHKRAAIEHTHRMHYIHLVNQWNSMHSASNLMANEQFVHDTKNIELNFQT